MSNYLEEIKIFFKTIGDWLILMLVFTIFFFSFNLGTVEVLHHKAVLPVQTSNSFSAEIFSMMVHDVVPKGVSLIVTGPLVAFGAQVKISLLLALVFTLPVFLFRLMTYLSPALHKRERLLMYRVIFPAVLLFGIGVVFAYTTIAPSTFKVLYTFTQPIGVTPLLDVGEFVGLTLALLIMTGLAFVVPVAMVLLTAMGVIPSVFWRKNMKYAVTFLVIVSAIITPDGSGVSMALLALPTTILYGAGAFVSRRVESSNKKKRQLSNVFSN